MKPIKNQNIDFYEIFSKICYVLILLIILILFIENFIFSSNYKYLGFREIDDLAFQFSIRQVHENIVNKNWSSLIQINDYAYGWIYWIFISVITFPLYIINKIFIIEWLIIVVPRQISLLFTVFSLVVLHKILIHYKIPKWSSSGVLLIFLLLPNIGYYSMRFGTVTAVMFFSMLTFYLTIRNQKINKFELFKIILSLSIAGSIKLTGLLISPLILLLTYKRIKEKNKNLPSWAYIYLIIFLILLIIFSAPQLIFIYLKPQFLDSYLNNLEYFVSVAKSNNNNNFLENLFYGLFGSIEILFIYLLLIYGIINGIYNAEINRNNLLFKYDFCTVLLTIIICFTYLIFTVNSPSSINSYLTSILFLLFIGISQLSKSKNFIWILFLILFMLLSNLFRSIVIDMKSNQTNWNHASYFIKKFETRPEVDKALKIDHCLNLLIQKNNIKLILLDHKVHTFLNYFTTTDTKILYFYNYSEFLKLNLEYPFDLIILNINSLINQNLIIKNSSSQDNFQFENFNLECVFGNIVIYKKIN